MMTVESSEDRYHQMLGRPLSGQVLSGQAGGIFQCTMHHDSLTVFLTAQSSQIESKG